MLLDARRYDRPMRSACNYGSTDLQPERAPTMTRTRAAAAERKPHRFADAFTPKRCDRLPAACTRGERTTVHEEMGSGAATEERSAGSRSRRETRDLAYTRLLRSGAAVASHVHLGRNEPESTQNTGRPHNVPWCKPWRASRAGSGAARGPPPSTRKDAFRRLRPACRRA